MTILRHIRIVHIRLAALLLILMMIMTACDKDDKHPFKSKARKTVIIYMVAENSLSTYTSPDIREIINGRGDIPLDCNLVVYLDNTNSPCVYTYSAQTGQTLWKNYPEQDSCDSLVFRNTLQEITQAFPAEKYGLVMWSHSSGWIPGPNAFASQAQNKLKERPLRRSFGIDNNTNYSTDDGNELDIPVMRRMLEQLGIHWDFIFFDSCFMQCVEVDYELRNVCDWIIASPAEIPGDGAPYDKIMHTLFTDSTATTLPQIYLDNNKDVEYEIGIGKKTKGGLIISACRTSEMENLAAVMKEFIPRLFSEQREYDMYGAQTYCQFIFNSYWKPEYYDLGNVMNILLASPSDYEYLTEQLAKTYPVTLNTPFWFSRFYPNCQGVIIDPEHLACVSMFVPDSKYDRVKYNRYMSSMEWYKATGWDQTGW